jgi:hypothetical protein
MRRGPLWGVLVGRREENWSSRLQLQVTKVRACQAAQWRLHNRISNAVWPVRRVSRNPKLLIGPDQNNRQLG